MRENRIHDKPWRIAFAFPARLRVAILASMRLSLCSSSLRPIAVLLVCLPGMIGLGVQPLSAAGARAGLILAEAESFTRRGGWVIDPQFMDIMGSPYLLAHGLGRPVADAATDVSIPAAGRYRVWVRTKDWVAYWNAKGAPGRFQVLVSGRALETVFGAAGAEWHWQDGGLIDLPAGKISLALHDLTGFEGRCDAVLLSRDPDFAPPNRDPAMTIFRRACLGLPEEPERAGEYDFVVTGGGIAGTCAALAAARLGLKVALVQDRPVLGGNNSSEVRVWLQGARNDEPWPKIGDVVAELEQERRAHYGPANTADLYEDEKKLAIVRAEPNITLLLEHRVNGVEVANHRIEAVVAQSIVSGKRLRIAGRWFADCTGDASVGVRAGADFDMQSKGHMGPCNLWNVCEAKDAAGAVSAEPIPFPRCPWALDLSDKPFPGRSPTNPNPNQLGGWYWESGFDWDPIQEMEQIRDWNFRAMYGAWDALKNVDKVLPNYILNWSAHILGKRESRRLMGDVILTLEHLEKDRQFPDPAAPTGWSNDLHLPDPRYEKGFEGDAFIARAHFGQYPALGASRPYWIPYRCLYSRNIANLFMAGRNISVAHEALGAVRVMRTCGAEGEVIGMAASLCRKHNATPRAVYETHLSELQDLMRRGAGKVEGARIPYINQGRRVAPAARAARVPPAIDLALPAWLQTAGANLARAARITLPGASETGSQSAPLLNDGLIRVDDNAGRWVHRAPLPHWIEFAWNAPVRIGAARIVSGYYSDGAVQAPIQDFLFQWHDGAAWKDIPGGAIRGNPLPVWSGPFDPVQTARIRLGVTATQNDISRIWEVELYGRRTE